MAKLFQVIEETQIRQTRDNSSTKTTEYKLKFMIMEYWFKCILKKNDRYADGDINELLEEFVHDCKVSYHSDDLDITVLNLTNSQKRKLYKMMLESGILER